MSVGSSGKRFRSGVLNRYHKNLANGCSWINWKSAVTIWRLSTQLRLLYAIKDKAAIILIFYLHCKVIASCLDIVFITYCRPI